jgi:hypothetical protein
MVAPVAIAQTRNTFIDTQDHWARTFIQNLAQENLVSGFADRTFRPDTPITREQLDSILNQVFVASNLQLPRRFNQSEASYWTTYNFQTNRQLTASQIQSSDQISRLQVVMALVGGLGLTPRNNSQTTLGVFQDASRIPRVAVDGVAAATEAGLIVNYPDVQFFDPNKPATRAEVAAFIYQALVSQGTLFDPIATRNPAYPYIVQATTTMPSPTPTTATTPANPTNIGGRVSANTVISVRHPQAQRLVLAPGESQSLTLLVNDNIANARGRVLIPKDSQIEGRLDSRFNGSQFLGVQFVAQRLIIGSQTYAIEADSRLISSQPAENISQQTINESLISTAAQAVLGAVTGRGGGLNLESILGVILGSNRPAPGSNNQLVIIEPTRDLGLTLRREIAIARD